MKPILAFAVIALAAHAAHAQEQRELGAHAHGESTLDIAVEGNKVTMALSAPAMDLVGFEHEPSTDEQRAAIERATLALSNPLDAFVPTEEAGCTPASASIEHVFEEHEEGHEEAGGAAASGAAEAGHEEEAAHSEFEAKFELTCANPAALAGIDFRFFELFPNAESVEVQVVTGQGQSSYEVERGTPRLDLKNLMQGT